MCLGVDAVHHGDLRILFQDVFLIYAEGVYPDWWTVSKVFVLPLVLVSATLVVRQENICDFMPTVFKGMVKSGKTLMIPYLWVATSLEQFFDLTGNQLRRVRLHTETIQFRHAPL